MQTTYDIETELANFTKTELELDKNMSFLDWLSFCDTNDAALTLRRQKQIKIVDAFIKNNPKLQPLKQNDDTDNSNYLPADNSPSNYKDWLISETLAKIYIQQKKYKLAKTTIKKLILLYPEKKRYFAALLESVNIE